MNAKIGPVGFEGDVSASGFDFSITLPHHNKQFDYILPRQVFAIWFARGCDCGIFIRGLGEARRTFRAAGIS